MEENYLFTIIVGILLLFNIFIRFRYLNKLISRDIKFYSDEQSHIAFGNILKKSKIDVRLLNKIFFLSRNINYPMFYHRMNEILRLKTIKQKRIFTFTISFFSSILYVLLFHDDFSINILLLVVCYMLCSLLYFGINSISIFSYSPRIFSDFLIFTCINLLFKYHLTGEEIYLICISIPFSVLYFTSKFGIQFSFIFSIFYFFASFDYLIFFPFGLSLFTSFILSNKNFLDILKGNYYCIMWYSKNIKYITDKKLNNINSFRKLYWYLNSIPIIGMLMIFIPYTPILAYFTIFYDIDIEIKSIVISTLIISLITCVKPFIIIGPSFRYLSPVIPYLISVILNQGFISKEYFLTYLMFEYFISIIIFFRYVKKDYLKENVNAEYDLLVNKINLKGKKILSSPINISTSHFGKNIDFKTKFFEYFSFDKNSVVELNKYMDPYPFIIEKKEILNDINLKYNLDYFIVDKILANDFFKKDNAYDEIFSSKKIVYNSKRFKIFKF